MISHVLKWKGVKETVFKSYESIYYFYVIFKSSEFNFNETSEIYFSFHRKHGRTFTSTQGVSENKSEIEDW